MTFFVPGLPIPQPRPSFNGRFAYYRDNGSRDYRAAVAWEAKKHFPRPLDGIWRVRLLFQFKRPTSHFTSRGELTKAAKLVPVPLRVDADNIAKGFLDACQGVVFTNDSAVASITAEKCYGPINGTFAALRLLTPEEIPSGEAFDELTSSENRGTLATG